MIPIFDFDGTILNTKPLVPYINQLKTTSDNKTKKEIWKQILNHIKDCNLYTGFNKVFEYITDNNLASAIVSNSSLQKITPCCDYFKIPIPKELQIGGYTLNRYGNIKKPNPILIYEAVKRLKVDLKDVVLVGNSAIDVQTAINANIPSIACTWDADDLEEMLSLNPTYIANQPKDILPFLYLSD